MKDSRGFTGFFACDCHEHAYHSNCDTCVWCQKRKLTKGSIGKRE